MFMRINLVFSTYYIQIYAHTEKLTDALLKFVIEKSQRITRYPNISCILKINFI